MNASIHNSDHPSIVYYDSDYPSTYFPVYKENVDEVIVMQGILHDVDLFKNRIHEVGLNVLELCAGTGRVAIPLVLSGCNVTAIDISAPLLKRFKFKVKDLEHFPFENLNIIKQDVTKLSLPKRDFDIVVCAFNSLQCIPDFRLQQQTLIKAAEHLRSGGSLMLDLTNPMTVNFLGDAPEFFFKRRRVDNGNYYSRFAATGPVNADQVQLLYGWYDETLQNGSIKRSPYNLEWRLIFRYELELMLEKSGFIIKAFYGGHMYEPFTPTSMKMIVEAVKA
jgi:ubiquinone/menaquinone biosynthesis C-methylase UbiE